MLNNAMEKAINASPQVLKQVIRALERAGFGFGGSEAATTNSCTAPNPGLRATVP